MEKEKDTHEDKTSRAVTGINLINIPKGKDEAFVSITTLAKRIDMHPNTLKKSIISLIITFSLTKNLIYLLNFKYCITINCLFDKNTEK